MALTAKIENGIVYSPYPPSVIPEISVYEAVKRFLQKWGQKVILVEGDVSLKCDELLLHIQRAAAGFQAHGVKRGECATIYYGNTIAGVIAGLGLVAAGATLHLAKALYNLKLTYEVKDSGSCYLVTDKRHTDIATQLDKEHKLKAMFTIDGAIPGFVNVEDYQTLSETTFKEVQVPDTRKEILAILYTSGTTGFSKGAEMSHYAYVNNITNAAYLIPATDTDVFLASSPFTHLSGFVFTITTMSLGATIVIGPAGSTFQSFYEVVTKNNVSSVFLFPTKLRWLTRTMEETAMRTPTVKKICTGGGPVQSDLAAKVMEIFKLQKFKNLYGLTESCGLVCGTLNEDISYQSMGYPAPGVEIKIVHAISKKVLGPGQKGELVVKIPNVMIGYRNRPEDTAKVLQDGWLFTGDCAYYNEDGKFFFVERLKEMIKCLDHQVTPAELEDVLQQHPSVAEAAVVGIPNPLYGEAPTAFVVLKPSHTALNVVKPDMLQQHVNKSSADFKHLYGGVHIVRELPKTESGKVARSRLKQNPPQSPQ
ncbi:uncharacterized protein LOC135400849 isoform X2 [Ornithodoros turicata]|uniref:uncharacterized protein LOC135400849 isoform X2 n=1 Tax=Ornithodoros turicata TaxID=34597 RepID=UPI00313A2363